MSIRIMSDGVQRIRVTLVCDAASGMFCRGFESFEHPDGFVGAHSAAIAKGWLDRQASQGRTWLCPECSGKHR
jgi:hypothetical protein